MRRWIEYLTFSPGTSMVVAGCADLKRSRVNLLRTNKTKLNIFKHRVQSRTPLHKKLIKKKKQKAV